VLPSDVHVIEQYYYTPIDNIFSSWGAVLAASFCNKRPCTFAQADTSSPTFWFNMVSSVMVPGSALESTPMPTRTIWELVYSSSAMIFACIWISLHPNVPGRRDGRIGRLKPRIWLMLIAFIAPEIIVLFALRQRSVARALYKSTSSTSLRSTISIYE
jgi:hypothetical protein